MNGDVVLQPFNRVGGTVNIEAGKGDIKTQLISTNGQKEDAYTLQQRKIDANGGAITLNAANGSILTSNLLSYSNASGSGTAGNGGAITLSAGANINTENLSSGSNSDSGTAGNGGGITLSAGENINT
ncbi:MAG: hypothetical protein PUP92_33310, partial [Rhizonema sp. PD38]|nr:hypothetical protein [Rhizonema sp. PD38]